MSASEWDRITNERDEAIYHLRQLTDSIKNSVSWDVVHVRADRAIDWLKENDGDDDE